MDDLDVEALLREADPAEPAYVGDIAAALRASRSAGPQRRPGGAGRGGCLRRPQFSWRCWSARSPLSPGATSGPSSTRRLSRRNP